MNILLAHGSYVLITVVLILTGSGLPVPEEVPIIAAGILSANETLNPLIAWACCLFGAIVGDSIMYWIGYHFGRGVLADHPWWARWVTPQREAQIEEKFLQHGFKVFLVARFLVGLRSPVYLTAGILRVSFKRFFLIDLFCATAVVSTFFGLTYLFGQYIPHLIHEGQIALTVVAVIALAGAAFYLWRRYRRKHAVLRQPAPKDAAPTSDPGKAPVDEVPNDEAPDDKGPVAKAPANKVKQMV